MDLDAAAFESRVDKVAREIGDRGRRCGAAHHADAPARGKAAPVQSTPEGAPQGESHRATWVKLRDLAQGFGRGSFLETF